MYTGIAHFGENGISNLVKLLLGRFPSYSLLGIKSENSSNGLLEIEKSRIQIKKLMKKPIRNRKK